MNVKKIRSTKALKFLGLLISATLIATVSAAVYNYMYQDATISVEAWTLQWDKGADNVTAGTAISGETCELTSLKGPANGTRIYEDPVRLNNTGGSSVTFDLLIDQVAGDTDQMESIIVRLYNVTNSASIGNLTVWSSGAKGSDLPLTITANTAWKFQWEITWKATAAANTLTVKLKVRVPA
jgi:hypothetical protein